MRDIAEWLDGLGLGKFASVFLDNEVDLLVLPRLSEDDLRELGLPLGARKKILQAAVDLEDPTRSHSAEPATAIVAERRQITVMFIDVVDSTLLSGQIDVEDLRSLVLAYQQACTEAIEHHGGYVAQYLGDGVLAYFGYPTAHEDDALRAVRAALTLMERMPEINRRLLEEHGRRLEIRAGLHTGLVVAGEMGTGKAREQLAVGETPNVAARVQSIAEPGSIVVSDATWRLVEGFFTAEPLGPRVLQGVGMPIPVHRIIAPTGVANPFEARAVRSMTPLVGREVELTLLRRRWEQAIDGEGQAVLVHGEAGIGKSRLIRAFRELLEPRPPQTITLNCSSQLQASAFHPIAEALRRAVGFARDDDDAVRRGKLRFLLASASVPVERLFPPLAVLLGVSTDDEPPTGAVDPPHLRRQTLDALVQIIAALATTRPLLVVVEDVHWIDPSTHELVGYLLDGLENRPIMMLLTARPGYHSPWGGLAHFNTLSLGRLSRRETDAMIRRVASTELSPGVIAQLVWKTDGIPLYIEELTKSVMDTRVDARAGPIALPASLQDALTARLDRLAFARHIAQIGAAIGRSFSYLLLRSVARLPEDELHAALARLVDSELVFQLGTPPNALYAFKHALVQDAALGSLLRGARRQLHARIAEALEAHSPELMDSQPELFAQHYVEGGLVEKAVYYWGKAAARSVARSAMAEAAAQLQKGLEQLALLPDTVERQRQELEFWSALGAALIVVKGNILPETGHACARARELWDQLGSPSEFLHIPYAQARYHALRGESDLARRLGEDLLRLSLERNDSAGLVLGHMSSGRDLMLVGSFASARSHLESVLALYDPIAHRTLGRGTGIYPHVNAEAYLGIVLFILGFPEQASAKSAAAIAEARTLAHAPSLALSLGIGTILLSLAGEQEVLRERAGELVALATEHGFPIWRGHGTMHQGWLNVESGQVSHGISLLRTGSDARRADGERMWLPHYLALLARAHDTAAQTDEALGVLDGTLQLVKNTGVRWLAAELHRHKGDMLLRQGLSDAAEAAYLAARGIAVEQGARLWELRAATSLARLRYHQDYHAEAQDILCPVYDWFTEGFATPDLKGAKELLDSLRGGQGVDSWRR